MGLAGVCEIVEHMASLLLEGGDRREDPLDEAAAGGTIGAETVLAPFIVLPLALIRSAMLGKPIIPIPVAGIEAPHGDLRVTSSPEAAEVYVDGTLRGSTPLVVELPAGKHSVRVDSPRLEHWRAAEVNVKDNVEHRLDVDLSE